MQNNDVKIDQSMVDMLKAKEGQLPTTSDDIRDLAEADPMAALMANVPHKSRHIAEFVLNELTNPSVRTERSEREIALNLQGRTIRRDIKQQVKFLKGRFYPASGERARARQLRQLERQKRDVT